MGNGPSTSNSTVFPVGTPAKSVVVQQNAAIVAQAVKTGDQLLLEKDVIDKVKEVSDIFKTFNTDDAKGLLSYVEKMNDKLKGQGDGLVISDDIKKALLTFHNAVLSQIDLSQIDGNLSLTDLDKQKQKDAKFVELMNKNKENPKENLEEIFKLLGQSVTKELDEKKKIIMQSQGISESKEMQAGVESIMGNVKSLKVKYKYFEYKYIELNIFLILFVQHVYATMHTFVNNIIEFNKQRDDAREKIIQDTMKLMAGILGEGEQGLNVVDTNTLRELTTKVQNVMKQKDDAMKQRLDEMVKVSTDNIQGFLSALTDATKGTMQAQLNQQPQQQGGFVRDHSRFPQAFYDLSKS